MKKATAPGRRRGLPPIVQDPGRRIGPLHLSGQWPYLHETSGQGGGGPDRLNERPREEEGAHVPCRLQTSAACPGIWGDDQGRRSGHRRNRTPGRRRGAESRYFLYAASCARRVIIDRLMPRSSSSRVLSCESSAWVRLYTRRRVIQSLILARMSFAAPPWRSMPIVSAICAIDMLPLSCGDLQDSYPPLR